MAARRHSTMGGDTRLRAVAASLLLLCAALSPLCPCAAVGKSPPHVSDIAADEVHPIEGDIVATPALTAEAARRQPFATFGAGLGDAGGHGLFVDYDQVHAALGQFDEPDEHVFGAHDYTDITAHLKRINNKYPHITHLYSAGKSTQGRELWVMVVSDNASEHELLEPEMKLVSNMHGNEVTGRECLLYMIYLLCDNYGKNDYVTKLVDSTRLHLMLSMNPDGYESATEGDRQGFIGRRNANNVDLNRNFPAVHPGHVDAEDGSAPVQAETKAVMRWLTLYPFVMSANFHGGSLVANYPYDDSVSGKEGDSVYAASADDQVFVLLSYSYARAHPTMWQSGRRCGLSDYGDTFYNGITNGAAWYATPGCMQDYNYMASNCLEITVEMGCFKFPYGNMSRIYWDEHKYSLLAFAQQVHNGVKGLVNDTGGTPLANATVAVEGISRNVTSASGGDYWRLLVPGQYRITVRHECCEPATKTVTVSHGKATRLDFELRKKRNYPDKFTLAEYSAQALSELVASTCGHNLVVETLHWHEPDAQPLYAISTQPAVAQGGGATESATPLQLLLVGAQSGDNDWLATAAAVNIAKWLCDEGDSASALDMLAGVQLHIIPQLPLSRLQFDTGRIVSPSPLQSWLDRQSIDALIVLNSDSVLVSTLSSNGKTNENDVNLKAFGNSLQKLLSPSTRANCAASLPPSAWSLTRAIQVSNAQSDMPLATIAVGLGCEPVDSEAALRTRANTVVQAAVKVVKSGIRLDSAATPPTTVVTGNTLPLTPGGVGQLQRLKDKCGELATDFTADDVTGLRLASADSEPAMRHQRESVTLLLGLQNETEPMLWRIGGELCTSASGKQLLRRMQVVLVPRLPTPLAGCQERIQWNKVQPYVDKIKAQANEITSSMMFSRGGMRSRYLLPEHDLSNVQSDFFAALAQNYADKQPLMDADDDICATTAGNERKSVGDIGRAWLTASYPILEEDRARLMPPPSLVIQTVCCYESLDVADTLYRDNAPAILDTLHRLADDGASIRLAVSDSNNASVPSPVRLGVHKVTSEDGSMDIGTYSRLKALVLYSTHDGGAFVNLPAGDYELQASRDGYKKSSSQFTVRSGATRPAAVYVQMQDDWTLLGLGRSAWALLLAAFTVTLMALCCCWWFGGMGMADRPGALGGKGQPWSAGFAPLPLSDSDDADSDYCEEQDSVNLTRDPRRFESAAAVGSQAVAQSPSAVGADAAGGSDTQRLVDL